jgi:hypothetical protein
MEAITYLGAKKEAVGVQREAGVKANMDMFDLSTHLRIFTQQSYFYMNSVACENNRGGEVDR